MITEMSKRIKQKRLEKGLTMEGLASQLGVGNSAVNKWEKGYVTNIKRSTIEKMAEIFNCDPAWLMGYDNEQVDHLVTPRRMDSQIGEFLVESNFHDNSNHILEYGKSISAMKLQKLQKAIDFYAKYEEASESTKASIDNLLKADALLEKNPVQEEGGSDK